MNVTVRKQEMNAYIGESELQLAIPLAADFADVVSLRVLHFRADLVQLSTIKWLQEKTVLKL